MSDMPVKYKQQENIRPPICKAFSFCATPMLTALSNA
jgi:hypothetical protein